MRRYRSAPRSRAQELHLNRFMSLPTFPRTPLPQTFIPPSTLKTALAKLTVTHILLYSFPPIQLSITHPDCPETLSIVLSTSSTEESPVCFQISHFVFTQTSTDLRDYRTHYIV